MWNHDLLCPEYSSKTHTYPLHFYNTDTGTCNDAMMGEWVKIEVILVHLFGNLPPNIGQIDCESDNRQKKVHFAGPRLSLLPIEAELLWVATFDYFRNWCHCKVDTVAPPTIDTWRGCGLSFVVSTSYCYSLLILHITNKLYFKFIILGPNNFVSSVKLVLHLLIIH